MAGSDFLNFKMKPGETFSSKFLEFLFEILGGNPLIEIFCPKKTLLVLNSLIKGALLQFRPQQHSIFF